MNEPKEYWTTFHGIERDGYGLGWKGERELVSKTFEPGKKYRVTGGSMGQSNTDLMFEGIEGRWNSVFFDLDIHDCPLIENPYTKYYA